MGKPIINVKHDLGMIDKQGIKYSFRVDDPEGKSLTTTLKISHYHRQIIFKNMNECNLELSPNDIADILSKQRGNNQIYIDIYCTNGQDTTVDYLQFSVKEHELTLTSSESDKFLGTRVSGFEIPFNVNYDGIGNLKITAISKQDYNFKIDNNKIIISNDDIVKIGELTNVEIILTADDGIITKPKTLNFGFNIGEFDVIPEISLVGEDDSWHLDNPFVLDSSIFETVGGNNLRSIATYGIIKCKRKRFNFNIQFKINGTLVREDDGFILPKDNGEVREYLYISPEMVLKYIEDNKKDNTFEIIFLSEDKKTIYKNFTFNFESKLIHCGPYNNLKDEIVTNEPTELPYYLVDCIKGTDKVKVLYNGKELYSADVTIIENEYGNLFGESVFKITDEMIKTVGKGNAVKLELISSNKYRDVKKTILWKVLDNNKPPYVDDIDGKMRSHFDYKSRRSIYQTIKASIIDWNFNFKKLTATVNGKEIPSELITHTNERYDYNIYIEKVLDYFEDDKPYTVIIKGVDTKGAECEGSLSFIAAKINKQTTVTPAPNSDLGIILSPEKNECVITFNIKDPEENLWERVELNSDIGEWEFITRDYIGKRLNKEGYDYHYKINVDKVRESYKNCSNSVINLYLHGYDSLNNFNSNEFNHHYTATIADLFPKPKLTGESGNLGPLSKTTILNFDVSCVEREGYYPKTLVKVFVNDKEVHEEKRDARDYKFQYYLTKYHLNDIGLGSKGNKLEVKVIRRDRDDKIISSSQSCTFDVPYSLYLEPAFSMNDDDLGTVLSYNDTKPYDVNLGVSDDYASPDTVLFIKNFVQFGNEEEHEIKGSKYFFKIDKEAIRKYPYSQNSSHVLFVKMVTDNFIITRKYSFNIGIVLPEINLSATEFPNVVTEDIDFKYAINYLPNAYANTKIDMYIDNKLYKSTQLTSKSANGEHVMVSCDRAELSKIGQNKTHKIKFVATRLDKINISETKEFDLKIGQINQPPKIELSIDKSDRFNYKVTTHIIDKDSTTNTMYVYLPEVKDPLEYVIKKKNGVEETYVHDIPLKSLRKIGVGNSANVYIICQDEFKDTRKTLTFTVDSLDNSIDLSFDEPKYFDKEITEGVNTNISIKEYVKTKMNVDYTVYFDDKVYKTEKFITDEKNNFKSINLYFSKQELYKLGNNTNHKIKVVAHDELNTRILEATLKIGLVNELPNIDLRVDKSNKFKYKLIANIIDNDSTKSDIVINIPEMNTINHKVDNNKPVNVSYEEIINYATLQKLIGKTNTINVKATDEFGTTESSIDFNVSDVNGSLDIMLEDPKYFDNKINNEINTNIIITENVPDKMNVKYSIYFDDKEIKNGSFSSYDKYNRKSIPLTISKHELYNYGNNTNHSLKIVAKDDLNGATLVKTIRIGVIDKIPDIYLSIDKSGKFNYKLSTRVIDIDSKVCNITVSIPNMDKITHKVNKENPIDVTFTDLIPFKILDKIKDKTNTITVEASDEYGTSLKTVDFVVGSMDGSLKIRLNDPSYFNKKITDTIDTNIIIDELIDYTMDVSYKLFIDDQLFDSGKFTTDGINKNSKAIRFFIDKKDLYNLYGNNTTHSLRVEAEDKINKIKTTKSIEIGVIDELPKLEISLDKSKVFDYNLTVRILDKDSKLNKMDVYIPGMDLMHYTIDTPPIDYTYDYKIPYKVLKQLVGKTNTVEVKASDDYGSIVKTFNFEVDRMYNSLNIALDDPSYFSKRIVDALDVPFTITENIDDTMEVKYDVYFDDKQIITNKFTSTTTNNKTKDTIKINKYTLFGYGNNTDHILKIVAKDELNEEINSQSVKIGIINELPKIELRLDKSDKFNYKLITHIVDTDSTSNVTVISIPGMDEIKHDTRKGKYINETFTDTIPFYILKTLTGKKNVINVVSHDEYGYSSKDIDFVISSMDGSLDVYFDDPDMFKNEIDHDIDTTINIIENVSDTINVSYAVYFDGKTYTSGNFISKPENCTMVIPFKITKKELFKYGSKTNHTIEVVAKDEINNTRITETLKIGVVDSAPIITPKSCDLGDILRKDGTFLLNFNVEDKDMPDDEIKIELSTSWGYSKKYTKNDSLDFGFDIKACRFYPAMNNSDQTITITATDKFGLSSSETYKVHIMEIYPKPNFYFDISPVIDINNKEKQIINYSVQYNLPQQFNPKTTVFELLINGKIYINNTENLVNGSFAKHIENIQKDFAFKYPNVKEKSTHNEAKMICYPSDFPNNKVEIVHYFDTKNLYTDPKIIEPKDDNLGVLLSGRNDDSVEIKISDNYDERYLETQLYPSFGEAIELNGRKNLDYRISKDMILKYPEITEKENYVDVEVTNQYGHTSNRRFMFKVEEKYPKPKISFDIENHLGNHINNTLKTVSEISYDFNICDTKIKYSLNYDDNGKHKEIKIKEEIINQNSFSNNAVKVSHEISGSLIKQIGQRDVTLVLTAERLDIKERKTLFIKQTKILLNNAKPVIDLSLNTENPLQYKLDISVNDNDYREYDDVLVTLEIPHMNKRTYKTLKFTDNILMPFNILKEIGKNTTNNRIIAIANDGINEVRKEISFDIGSLQTLFVESNESYFDKEFVNDFYTEFKVTEKEFNYFNFKLYIDNKVVHHGENLYISQKQGYLIKLNLPKEELIKLGMNKNHSVILDCSDEFTTVRISKSLKIGYINIDPEIILYNDINLGDVNDEVKLKFYVNDKNDKSQDRLYTRITLMTEDENNKKLVDQINNTERNIIYERVITKDTLIDFGRLGKSKILIECLDSHGGYATKELTLNICGVISGNNDSIPLTIDLFKTSASTLPISIYIKNDHGLDDGDEEDNNKPKDLINAPIIKELEEKKFISALSEFLDEFIKHYSYRHSKKIQNARNKIKVYNISEYEKLDKLQVKHMVFSEIDKFYLNLPIKLIMPGERLHSEKIRKEIRYKTISSERFDEILDGLSLDVYENGRKIPYSDIYLTVYDFNVVISIDKKYRNSKFTLVVHKFAYSSESTDSNLKLGFEYSGKVDYLVYDNGYLLEKEEYTVYKDKIYINYKQSDCKAEVVAYMTDYPLIRHIKSKKGLFKIDYVDGDDKFVIDKDSILAFKNRLLLDLNVEQVGANVFKTKNITSGDMDLLVLYSQNEYDENYYIDNLKKYLKINHITNDNIEKLVDSYDEFVRRFKLNDIEISLDDFLENKYEKMEYYQKHKVLEILSWGSWLYKDLLDKIYDANKKDIVQTKIMKIDNNYIKENTKYMDEFGRDMTLIKLFNPEHYEMNIFIDGLLYNGEKTIGEYLDYSMMYVDKSYLMDLPVIEIELLPYDKFSFKELVIVVGTDSDGNITVNIPKEFMPDVKKNIYYLQLIFEDVQCSIYNIKDIKEHENYTVLTLDIKYNNIHSDYCRVLNNNVYIKQNIDVTIDKERFVYKLVDGFDKVMTTEDHIMVYKNGRIISRNYFSIVDNILYLNTSVKRDDIISVLYYPFEISELCYIKTISDNGSITPNNMNYPFNDKYDTFTLNGRRLYKGEYKIYSNSGATIENGESIYHVVVFMNKYEVCRRSIDYFNKYFIKGHDYFDDYFKNIIHGRTENYENDFLK